MGFGSATPGMASGLFVSRFYSAYGILRYDYLQIPTLFLQVGMIGVAAYLVAIFSPAIQGYRDRKQFGTERKWVLSLALTFAMLFFVNCFYMATMRTQFTFLWALMLVAPYLAYGKSDSVKVGR
jgi:ABC-type multidrug transport system permease subunit